MPDPARAPHTARVFRTSRPLVLAAALLSAAGALWSCSTTPGSPSPGAATPPPTTPTKHAALPTPESVKAMTPIAPPTLANQKPKDYPGLHTLVAYHDGFISGGAPEGDVGLDTLAAMGFKTIISVDGTEPEVGAAAARGIRYIHLPIGYNGFDEARKLQLVRATRDAIADGPVYIHCHHGKHRSAGAAAAVAASLGWLTPEQGVERMKVSGTAPNYTGLYACASAARPIDPGVIDAVAADFPSVSKPSGFVHAMVEIDEAYDRLKLIEKAGWTTPSDHPDLVPAAEAGRIADLFRDAGTLAYVKQKPADFAAKMTSAYAAAQGLEDLLAAAPPGSPGGGTPDATAKLSSQFKLLAASCKDCHAKYRD